MAVAKISPNTTRRQLHELLERERKLDDLDDTRTGRGIWGWTLVAIAAWTVAGLILGWVL